LILIIAAIASAFLGEKRAISPDVLTSVGLR
jgi:hypothetical protein